MQRLRSIVSTLAFVAATQACSTPESAVADSAGTNPPASGPLTPAQADSARADSLAVVADRSRILGRETAPVWVVVVSDFQCPYCKVWHDETFPALKREFIDRGRIRLAYLNFPLPQHQHARGTAELALCAGLQGQFWEYHDAIFDSQAVWSALPAGTAWFDSIPVAAPIDRDALKRCVSSGAMRAVVEADFQRARAAQARTTPTFFIGNEIRLEGAQPIESFRQAIAAASGGASPTAIR